MKLGGQELLFGEGTLAHLATLKYKKAVIVLANDVMIQNGVMSIIKGHLTTAQIPFESFIGIESDPGFSTVMRGAEFMRKHEPDLIIAVGGGSAMDAAKAMWIYYENPEIKDLVTLMDKNKFPLLRKKAKLICIPSTAGTASEVSRSIVITDDKTGIKYGIGNMEMVPDIAICDPVTTLSLPKSITAETGMDAMCHALEAIVSNRANYISDILAEKAILDIFETLPKVLKDGSNVSYREKMLTAAMVAGLAFTNVSLGITHSIAHGLGSLFKMPHGLANAILLPYIVEFNSQNESAKKIYDGLATKLGYVDLVSALKDLNHTLGIPSNLSEKLSDKSKFDENLSTLIEYALSDGCTKTNPIIPTKAQMQAIIELAYKGGQ
jgi:alcohol dehydrogenase class IV